MTHLKRWVKPENLTNTPVNSCQKVAAGDNPAALSAALLPGLMQKHMLQINAFEAELCILRHKAIFVR